VRSFKLTILGSSGGAGETLGFVPDFRVQTRLATLPSSFDILDLGEDATIDDPLDVVAAIPTGNGPRLQVNLGKEVDGESLAAVSDTLAAGRNATNPIVRLMNIDRFGSPELMVMTDEGIDVFCLDGRSSEGAMCAP
jgi:hypothetical protein